MSIKVLAVGDLHIKDSMLFEHKKMINAIVSLCKKLSPDLVVLLGDTLHKHEHIEMRSLCESIDLFNRLRKISKVVVLIGNHDRENPDDFMTNIHPFSSIVGMDNPVIVPKTKMMDIEGISMCFVPYVPPGRFEEALSVVDWKSSDVIFAHQEFRGCRMGSISSEIGDKWPASNPLVISGHIHLYQKLSDNLIYVGTPAQHTFGETAKKTVSLFTFSNEKGFSYVEKRISLGMKPRISVQLTCKQARKYKPPKDKFVRIVLSDREENISAFLSSGSDSEISSKVEKLSINVTQIEIKPFVKSKNFLQDLEEQVSDVPGEKKEFIRIFK